MLSTIVARSPAQPAIDYKALALRVAHATPPGGHAPLAALRLLSDEAHTVERGEGVREMEEALRLVLGGTRDMVTSPTMRVIQHFTLGSSLYTEVYGQPAQFETGSLLRDFDRPTLSEAEGRALESSMRREGRRAAAYTLRLSRPLDLPTSGAEFAPEAEIALETAGMAWLPLVGYGHVRWLAARHGVAPDAFVKPSPVHALAALGRAVEGGERQSLEAVFDLGESGQVNELLRGLRERPLTCICSRTPRAACEVCARRPGCCACRGSRPSAGRMALPAAQSARRRCAKVESPSTAASHPHFARPASRSRQGGGSRTRLPAGQGIPAM